MKLRKIFALLLVLSVLMSVVGVLPAVANGATPSASKSLGPSNRYIMMAKSSADYAQMRAEAINGGATIVKEMPHVNMLVVLASTGLKNQLAGSSHVKGIGIDGIRTLVQPQMAQEMGFNATPGRVRINMGQGGKTTLTGGGGITGDPAFSLKGLMWSIDRVYAPQAWKHNAGDPAVIVGVADTGLDFTHPELANKVLDVVDLTDTTLCTDYFGYGDADLASAFGGPVTTDWNGHGSWIGGNIAGDLDGVGINGIAPEVGLVSLKISEWCGYAYDSSILDAFQYAADNGIDVVSISFGGYLDRTIPDQNATYAMYVGTVAYARTMGTVIVAAAGNEHVRIGAGGQVLSHGPLTTPGTTPAGFLASDVYGLWETPGGIPGVVDVSSTGNVVNHPSRCDPSTIGSPSDSEAVCKPGTDAHKPFGIGKQNQLAYYSNYGPRIDIAAPGGARKFNLPTWDRGGTEGWPYVGTGTGVFPAEGYNAWEDFSITSNWAMEIPCFFDIGPQFYTDACYSTIQGTSMATPHVSAVLALIASSHPTIRHNPDKLIAVLKASAWHISGNTTPPLSATDLSAGDRTGVDCPSGYCHLGGRTISNLEAYGAGLVDAVRAVLFNLRSLH